MNEILNLLTPQNIEILVVCICILFALSFFIFRKGTKPPPLKTPNIENEGKPDLRSLLSKTRTTLAQKLESLISKTKKFDNLFLDGLEELLYTSDLGPKTVLKLLEATRSKFSHGDPEDLQTIKKAFYTEILSIISVAETKSSYGSCIDFSNLSVPWVILVVGVNGVGKTTSIGKLAHFYAKAGKKVLVVAGDTFRAAAGEQLEVWGERAQVEVFSSEKTTEPAAVAYEGIQRGIAEKYEVVIIDTAGRLHTKDNLMEELKKIKRVTAKALQGAPNEVILVVDANSGQNALVQATQFNQAVGVSSLIVTKLDGTAKGGIIVGIAEELRIGVQFIGLGEKVGDLSQFSPEEYAKALIDL